ncbi:MAG: hypothetical protein ACI8RD_011078 [Bacillariaceae sp.]|jgi:hypothetical protein
MLINCICICVLISDHNIFSCLDHDEIKNQVQYGIYGVRLINVQEGEPFLLLSARYGSTFVLVPEVKNILKKNVVASFTSSLSHQHRIKIGIDNFVK